jgi:predicted transcriptional regulator
MYNNSYSSALESAHKIPPDEVSLKVLCACSELNRDCSKLRIMNATFLSSKRAEEYLNSLDSEGFIQYNKELQKCELTNKGLLFLNEKNSK